MEVKDIEQIVQMVPTYIEYIYPGLLFMFLYQFFAGKHLTITRGAIIVAICLSYVMKEVIIYLFGTTAPELHNMLLVVMAILFPYIAYRLTRIEAVTKILELLDIYTRFDENEVEASMDSNDSAWLVVYLKSDDVVYEGSLGLKELEDGKRQFITLKAYRKYFLGEDGRPKEPYIIDNDDYEEKVVLYMDDIKRYEVRHVNG